MKRNVAFLFALAAAILFSAAAYAANPHLLQPGLWEVTIKTLLSDGTPTTVTEICITKEEADHPEPPKRGPRDDCQATSITTGNHVSYQVNCGRKHVNTNGEFTYTGDRYEGTVTIKQDNVEIKQVHTARRIGDCQDQ